MIFVTVELLEERSCSSAGGGGSGGGNAFAGFFEFVFVFEFNFDLGWLSSQHLGSVLSLSLLFVSLFFFVSHHW